MDADRAPAEVLVRLEGVEQFYDRKIRILGPLDLEVREGEFLSLVGPVRVREEHAAAHRGRRARAHPRRGAWSATGRCRA